MHLRFSCAKINSRQLPHQLASANQRHLKDQVHARRYYYIHKPDLWRHADSYTCDSNNKQTEKIMRKQSRCVFTKGDYQRDSTGSEGRTRVSWIFKTFMKVWTLSWGKTTVGVWTVFLDCQEASDAITSRRLVRNRISRHSLGSRVREHGSRVSFQTGLW